MKRKLIAFLLACMLLPSLSAGATIEDDDDKAQDKNKIEQKMEEKMKKDETKNEKKEEKIKEGKKQEKKEEKIEEKQKEENKTEEIKKEDINKIEEEKKEKKKEEINISLPKLKCKMKNNETNNILYKYEWKSDKDNSKEQKEIINEKELSKKLTPTKVKSGEVIILDFEEKPSKVEAEAVGKDKVNVNISGNKMEVPKCKGPYVVNIHTKYKNGTVHYAIMLEIME